MGAPTDLAARLLAEVGSAPRWRQPVLVALMGLPGAGKTATGAYLASRLPLAVLSTDAIRLRYGLASGPATFEVTRVAAARLLAAGAGVLLDGIHLGREHREGWRAVAGACRARFELVYATAPAAVVAARLRARPAAPEEATARGAFVITPEHVRRIAAHLEEPTPDEGAWVVDTSVGSPSETASALERHLRVLVA